MDRRRFLAAATVAGALPLAGCSRDGLGTIELDAPETETEQNETHLIFRRGDRRLLVFTARDRGRSDASGPIPLDLHVWHAEDTHLDSFRIEIRAPADGRDPLTEVYLRSPWYDSGPKLDFHRGDDGRTTVLAADDLGGPGEGTLSLELILEPTSMPDALPVGVSGEFGLSETGTLGRSYRAEGQMTVALVSEREE